MSTDFDLDHIIAEALTKHYPDFDFTDSPVKADLHEAALHLLALADAAEFYTQPAIESRFDRNVYLPANIVAAEKHLFHQLPYRNDEEHPGQIHAWEAARDILHALHTRIQDGIIFRVSRPDISLEDAALISHAPSQSGRVEGDIRTGTVEVTNNPPHLGRTGGLAS